MSEDEDLEENNLQEPPLPHIPLSNDIPGPVIVNSNGLQYSSLVKKPNPFTGDKRNVNIMLWLKKLELFLTCNNVPRNDYLRVAICFLDGPALDLFLAHKHDRQNRNVWTNTYEEFSSILLKAYGHIDEDFSLRTKITKLQLRDNNVLGYTKLFHTLVHKLQKNIPTDVDKITWFFSGIQDKTLYADLIINPGTGLRWETWDTLYYYIMSKYSFLQNHFKNSNQPQSNRPFRSSSKFRSFTKRPYPSNFSKSFSMNRNNRSNWNTKPSFRSNSYNNRPSKFQRTQQSNRRPNFRSRFNNNSRNFRGNFRNPQRYNPQSNPNRNRYDMQTLDISKLVPGQPLSAAQRQYLASAKLCYKCFKPGHLGSNCNNSRNTK